MNKLTGKNAITAAADLLCRNEQHTHFPDETLLSCALSALNSVYADLFCLCRPDEQFEPLWTLDDKIDLPPNILHDGFLYGVAYMLAQADGDFETVERFCRMYNDKRAKCQRITAIDDKFLKGCDADVL